MKKFSILALLFAGVAAHAALSPINGGGGSGDATSLQGTPIAITAPVLNQVLQFDGSDWAPATVGGTGTVTSVGMSVPSFLSVAGSPVTGAGTLAVTLATQAANTVFAGPTTGAAAAPTFRSLVSNDIPNLSASKITSGQGTLSTSTTGVTVGSGANSLLSNATIDIQTATGAQPGLLSAADWTTFNGKQASGSYLTALTGDVAASGPGSSAATIASGVVTNAKLANMATQTIKGRTTAGSGAPEDLTATQATAILDTFVGDSGSGGTKGLVPAPGVGDAAKSLKGDGTWGISGDVSGPASSVDSEVALFDSTTGKLIKRATGTGVAKLTSGVLSAGSVNLTTEVSGVLPTANGGAFTPTITAYTSSTSMADPGPGCRILTVFGIGGGGGGGSGRKGLTTVARSGGSGGSAGVAFSVKIPYSTITSWPVAITIGAGGAGGASVSSDTTSGNPGSNGGDTSFGTYAIGVGGRGGNGGTATTVNGAIALYGSIPTSVVSGIAYAGGQSGVTAGNTLPGASGFAGSGGGGGGLTAANAAGAAQPGGANALLTAGGAINSAGADGDMSAPYTFFGGTGGGGGNGSTTTRNDGGAGGNYGAGGGGGNAASNGTFDSGKGGDGGPGFLGVICE